MSTAQSKNTTKQNRCELGESIYLQALAKRDVGGLRCAFRLMHRAARLGAYGSKHSIGYMYDLGIGVKKNRNMAISWYRRGVRAGDFGSATNIGTIYRDEMKTSLALRWFHKAVELGDIDANLEIAKLHLSRLNDPKTAARHLKRVLKAKGGTDVTIDSQEQAAALLKRIERKPSTKRSKQLRS